ncbi:hypothetical protein RCL1_006108 [Eukaryota sp. TZLM3-RCL]
MPGMSKTANVPKLKVTPSGTLWADRPFSRLFVDTIGPLPTDIQSRAYVLVFIDSFTRYTILVPFEELNAQEVAYVLVWNVCAIFGIHSDNGPELANAVFRGVCNLLAVEVSSSIPHFSQSNGLVERRHRDIPSNSFVSLQNLVTGSTTSAAACQCKLYITDLPVTSDLHKAVASGDCEEHLVNHIISVRDSDSGPMYTVEWFGGDISEIPLDPIKNTKAFAEFRPRRSAPLGSPPRKGTKKNHRSGKKYTVVVLSL